MYLTDDLRPVAESLNSWARGKSYIRRLWIYGSRARGDNRPNSDLDVAIEIDPVGNDEHAQTSFIAMAPQWRAEIKPHIPFEVHLQWFDPAGSYPPVQNGVNVSGVLIYERPA